MANDWIIWRKGLAKTRKIITVARILGVDRYAAAGRVMEAWEWVDSNTTDGLIRGVDPDEFDNIVGCPKMAEAMMCVGWMVPVGSDSINFPKFCETTPKTALHRIRLAERVAATRARGKAGLPKQDPKDKGKRYDTVTEALQEPLPECYDDRYEDLPESVTTEQNNF